MKGMSDYTATAIAEGWEPARDQAEYVEAWQHLIDTGLAFKLQGWFGRTAMELIARGICTDTKQHLRN